MAWTNVQICKWPQPLNLSFHRKLFFYWDRDVYKVTGKWSFVPSNKMNIKTFHWQKAYLDETIQTYLICFRCSINSCYYNSIISRHNKCVNNIATVELPRQPAARQNHKLLAPCLIALEIYNEFIEQPSDVLTREISSKNKPQIDSQHLRLPSGRPFFPRNI